MKIKILTIEQANHFLSSYRKVISIRVRVSHYTGVLFTDSAAYIVVPGLDSWIPITRHIDESGEIINLGNVRRPNRVIRSIEEYSSVFHENDIILTSADELQKFINHFQ